MLGNIIKTLKYTSHNHSQRLLLYKLAEQLTSGLGRFLECQKCNISYNTGTRALPDIYLLALGRCAYISGKALLPVL